MEKREFYSQRRVSQSYDALRFGGRSGEWVNRRELSVVRSLLPPAGRVLDLGCGTGRLGLDLAGGGYRVVGLDISAEMLRAARSKNGSGNVSWLQGDAFAPPLAGSTFDAVVALRVAFHFPDVTAVLAAAAGLAKPGGAVVLDTYNWSPRALAALGRRTWGPRVYAHRAQTVAQAAASLGLQTAAKRECFLFSPYIYRLLPAAVLPALERLERRVPATWRARVFWLLRQPCETVPF